MAPPPPPPPPPPPHVGIIFFLSHLLLLVSSKEQGGQNCPSTFKCSTLGVHGYPFTTILYPSCGICIINCTDQPFPTVRLSQGGPWYDVTNSIANYKAFLLSDWQLLHVVNDDNMGCDIFHQFFVDLDHLLPRSPSISFTILHNVTLWKCSNMKIMSNYGFFLRPIRACGSYKIYIDQEGSNFQSCSPILYPNQLIAELSGICSKCISEGGRCQDLKNGGFKCVNRKKGRRKLIQLLVLAISGGSIVLILLALVLWYLRSLKLGSSTFGSRNISSDPTRTDIDKSKMYFSLPIFSYTELEEATNNFDPTMELGDGGFGTVYYGKLNDGREVAVKRLYERNYRQIEQFMNEIEILTSLRHLNLVSLYGCTSRRSRELLLVYEYVPNGTVADQLHGNQAKCSILTWPIRMSIAIETAKALSYLHASEIIHRDVKSTNILLDNNFGVKVADFGLSRLFPTDVTHVSTVPQGTPGYLDPEYNQCYQLTSKSDVYSFGVVLVELISSLPAIDISRKDDEVNLSCYAMKRIQCCTFGELVDPRLGFESNYKVKRMTVLVAELAFRCLQHKKEFRPSMDEVLEALKSIECADYEKGNENCDGKLKRQTDDEHVWLLRNSPNSVMHKWGSSKSITPAASGEDTIGKSDVYR